jgi:hypothetical protein
MHSINCKERTSARATKAAPPIRLARGTGGGGVGELGLLRVVYCKLPLLLAAVGCCC